MRIIKRGDRITHREAEVVAHLISGGKSNREIAEQLGISDYTVKFHIENVMKKTGARNRVHIAAIFARTIA